MSRTPEQKRREYAEAYGGKLPPESEPEPPRRRSQFAEAFIAGIEAMNDPHKKRREKIHGWLAQNDFVEVPDYDAFSGKGDWVHKSGLARVSGGLVQDCVEGAMSWTDVQGMIAGELSAPR